jgi:hypothetical protein
MLGVGHAEHLRGAVERLPRQRQPPQPVHRVERELEHLRRADDAAVALEPVERGIGRGSTTPSAPQAVASSRRPGEKSPAITCRPPCASSMQITARPIDPQPIAIATWPLPTSPRRTACQVGKGM